MYVKRFIAVVCFFLCSTLTTSCATTKHIDFSTVQPVVKSKRQLLGSVVRITTVSPVPICDPKDPKKCLPPATILSSGTLVETPNGHKGILTVAHALQAFPPGQRVETYATLVNGIIVPAIASICDFRIDVCFMYIDNDALKDSRLSTLQLARVAPAWGDVVWYTGDPVGIASDFGGAIFPLLKGWFGGTSTFRNPWGIRKVSMVTAPAAQGASGSGLVNDNNEVVGVVQMVHPSFPFSTLTIEYGDLVTFLISIRSLEEYRNSK